MKIAAVVVLYNPTRENINNAFSYINEVDELLVFDNSLVSNNELYYSLLMNNKVKYVNFKQNYGIAYALNYAAKWAINSNYMWLLTMDQDSVLDAKNLKKMKAYICSNNMKKTGIVAPWHETKLLIQKPSELIDHPLDVMASGNIVNLQLYEQIGGFKDWLFIDGVDIEYCLNLKKHGYKVDRLNSITMIHDLGDIKIKMLLGKKYICTFHNHLRNYYMQRNYRYIRDMYIDIEPDFCETLVKIKGIIFKILVFEDDKYRKIRGIFRGIHDYKMNRKGMYKSKS